MKKTILSSIVACLTLLGCKKDKQQTSPTSDKKVSWWAINNDTFRTTETKMGLYSQSFFLYYENDSNTIAFSIDIDTTNRNISNDSFKMYSMLRYGNSAVHNYFNEGHYSSFVIAADSSVIYSVNEGGKIKLTLPPTLYRREILSQGGADTAIIQGVFYQP